MAPEDWAGLMNDARKQAGARRHRVRVRAFELSERSARLDSTRWAYIIECPLTCPCRSW